MRPSYEGINGQPRRGIDAGHGPRIPVHGPDGSGEEEVMMDHHGLNVTYADISVMLGLGLIIAWLRLRGRDLSAAVSPALLCLSGHLRRRPDQAMECALRTAFTQLDEELAVVLGDRPIARPRR
jgi:hypothetical protein